MKNWEMAYAPNYEAKTFDLKTIADIEKQGLNTIKASVPGNFEQDFMREGLLEDLYFSTNTLKAQKFENLHLWYFTEFELDDINSHLHFNGIDTVADIFINGKLAKTVDNMFMEYDVYGDFHKGKNEVVVHIKPVCIESRKRKLPVAASNLKYNYAGVYMRKAPHMFGWDIMPRIVSAGLWKNVEIRKNSGEGFSEVFVSTTEIEPDCSKATLKFFTVVDAEGDHITDYSVRIYGNCKDSSFDVTERLWHNSYQFLFEVEKPRLWWPKNSGEQNLYETTVELLYKGNVIDTKKLNIGIRTVNLNRTDVTDKDGNGEFCFEINDKKIFVLGTNWVPLDALHSNDANRLDKALDLLDDCGCNMVRCWGGNVYESKEFFDFCDSHGIMVWQDFGMGCGVYPQEQDFFDKIEEEAVFEIKRLRNHTSLVLWAGDNECDASVDGVKRVQNDPNDNMITRYILKRAVMSNDTSRPYLPSSPFISEKAYAEKLPIPEDHLWGPRDYFKGEFYSTAVCHFASETGYHGFPSVSSLKKFLKNPEKIFKEDFIPTDEYMVHAAAMELNPKNPYAFRIKLAYDQVETLFGKAEENLDDFVKQSQISQAEAKKYFIERFRISKWRRTGIIWWNLIDGWPQVSDAVVDYYHTKKLAYHYIKRSQEPVCLMCDEPEDGYITLCGSNNLPDDKTVEYAVTKVSDGTMVSAGLVRLEADSSQKIAKIPIEENEKEFYLIEWTMDGKVYKNHYFTNAINIDYKFYMKCLEKSGMNEFEY